jgi:hypothetical protein
MAYTNNVPQGNQQIATTQPLIQANFGFIKTGIEQEHNFNVAGSGSDMYHLQTSMPNKGSDPVALPSSTNGMYYVKGGVPKFYDGTTARFIVTSDSSVVPSTFSGGPITLTGVATTLLAIPNNSCGSYWLLVTNNQLLYNTGTFISANGVLILSKLAGPSVGIVVGTDGALAFQAISSGGSIPNVKWVIQVNTP